MATCEKCGAELEPGVIHAHGTLLHLNLPLLNWILEHGDKPMPPEVEAAAKLEAYRYRLAEEFGPRETPGSNL